MRARAGRARGGRPRVSPRACRGCPQPVRLEVGEARAAPARRPLRSIPGRSSASSHASATRTGSAGTSASSGQRASASPSTIPRATPRASAAPDTSPTRCSLPPTQTAPPPARARQRLAGHASLPGGHGQLEAGEVHADDHANICSHSALRRDVCGALRASVHRQRALGGAAEELAHEGVLRGEHPLRRRPLRRCARATAARCIRPIRRAEAMSWVTTM